MPTSSSLFAAQDEARDRDLALGYRMAFGFINQAGYEYVNARNVIGHPANVGSEMQSTSVNADYPARGQLRWLAQALKRRFDPVQDR